MPWILDEIIYYVHFFSENVIMMISNLIYLSLKSKQLGLAYFGGVLVFLILGRSFLKDCRESVIEKEIRYDEKHGKIEDILSNLITVYTGKQQESETKRIIKENNKIIDLDIKKGLCQLKYKVGFSIVNVLIFIALNFISFNLYKKGEINLSGLSAIFILNYNILNTLILYFKNAQQYLNISADYIYLNNFIESLPDFDLKAEKSKDNLRNTDYGIKIQFKNVYFKIKGTDNQIYDNLGVTIPENQNVVIMGSIGSGKSTFAKLLVKLQEPDKGKILLNGVNYDKLNIDNIIKNIIYIPQMPILFDRTLWENISYGFKRDEIKKKEVLDMLNQMGMEDLAEIFNERFDKSVGKSVVFGRTETSCLSPPLLGKANYIR